MLREIGRYGGEKTDIDLVNDMKQMGYQTTEPRSQLLTTAVRPPGYRPQTEGPPLLVVVRREVATV